jgi:hypothetical protein
MPPILSPCILLFEWTSDAQIRPDYYTHQRKLSSDCVCRQFAYYVCELSSNTVSRPGIPLISQLKISCVEFALDISVYFCWIKDSDVDGLKEGAMYGVNLLSDFKVEDGAGFRNFVRMSPIDFEVLLQMVGCKISSFNVFSLVYILKTCLGGRSRLTYNVVSNMSTLTNIACFPFPTGNKKHRIFVCGLFANTDETYQTVSRQYFQVCTSLGTG